MAENYFNEKTMRWHDGDTKKMIKNPFKSESTALAIRPERQQLSLAGAGAMAPIEGEAQPMSPMESVMAIFEEMRDSLNTLVENSIEQLALMKPTAGEIRATSIAGGKAPDGEEDLGGE